MKKFFKNVLLVTCWAAIIANGFMLSLIQAVVFLDGTWYLDAEDMNFVLLAVVRMVLAMILRLYIIRTVKVRQKGGETEES